MNSIKELQKLILQGETDWEQYGDVRATYKNDLVLFNYTHDAQYNCRWNWFERVSRGLILSTKSGEVVARPFDKFYNWLEGGRKVSGHIVTITTKIDGSLGILYRDNGFKIATRGSFDGEQATWATKHLQWYEPNIPEDLTLLFEIIYPENRIVIDYGNMEELILLAARNRFTGEYLPFYPNLYELADSLGFLTPEIFDFNNVDDIIEACASLSVESEGWVVEFSDGQRVKFKGDRYVELHRLVTNATFKRVLEAVRDNTYGWMVKDIPDELMDQIREWKQEIDRVVEHTVEKVESVYEEIKGASDRKAFAASANNHQSIAPYLFCKLDGKDYVERIYKLEFRERPQPTSSSYFPQSLLSYMRKK